MDDELAVVDSERLGGVGCADVRVAVTEEVEDLGDPSKLLLALSVVDRRAAIWRALRARRGLLIYAAIVLPWFIAISIASRGTFVQTAVGSDLLPKLMGGQEAPGAPPSGPPGPPGGTRAAGYPGTRAPPPPRPPPPPPPPYRSKTVPGGMVARTSAAVTGPCACRNRVPAPRMVSSSASAVIISPPALARSGGCRRRDRLKHA